MNHITQEQATALAVSIAVNLSTSDFMGSLCNAAIQHYIDSAAPNVAVELSDAEIKERFDAFASLYDQESNEWLDMGADVYFRAGYRAALLQSPALPVGELTPPAPTGEGA
jgi:hypothetical protein